MAIIYRMFAIAPGHTNLGGSLSQFEAGDRLALTEQEYEALSASPAYSNLMLVGKEETTETGAIGLPPIEGADLLHSQELGVAIPPSQIEGDEHATPGVSETNSLEDVFKSNKADGEGFLNSVATVSTEETEDTEDTATPKASAPKKTTRK